MFSTLDGFDFCRVQSLCKRGFPLDKAVWRVFLLRNPNWKNHPMAWFLRDSADSTDLGLTTTPGTPTVVKTRSGSSFSFLSSEEENATTTVESAIRVDRSRSPKSTESRNHTPSHACNSASVGHSPASHRPGSQVGSPLHRGSPRSLLSSPHSSLTPSPLASPSNSINPNHHLPLSPSAASSTKKHATSALHGVLSSSTSAPSSAHPSPTNYTAPPLSPHSPQVRRHFFHDPIYDRAMQLPASHPSDSM